MSLFGVPDPNICNNLSFSYYLPRLTFKTVPLPKCCLTGLIIVFILCFLETLCYGVLYIKLCRKESKVSVTANPQTCC